MAVLAGLRNIADNYAFHASVRGGRAKRLAYLTAYYLIFVVFRWGDRHGRCLSWLKGLGLSDWPVDVATSDGLRLRLDLHTAYDPLYSIVHLRDYQRLEAFRIVPGRTIIDAGANVGVYATLAAKLSGEGGKVVAIEPHPGNFGLLKSNVERNGLANVVLVNAAVSDREGEGALFIHERAVNHSLTRASGTKVPVKVRTLDSLARELGLSKVDVIKIDTEGNVPDILRGARGIVREHRPLIAIERDAGEESAGLLEFLKEAGYEWRDVDVFLYAWPGERPVR